MPHHGFQFTQLASDLCADGTPRKLGFSERPATAEELARIDPAKILARSLTWDATAVDVSHWIQRLVGWSETTDSNGNAEHASFVGKTGGHTFLVRISRLS